MENRLWPKPDPDQAAEYYASGDWRRKTLSQGLREQLSSNPYDIAIAGDNDRYSYAQFDTMARSMAEWLRSKGMQRGDVVAFQLPNWHEVAALALASSMLGLVCLPIVPIYREAELRFILRASGARIFLTPSVFRGFDYAEMARRLQAEIPSLETVVSLRDPDSENPFAAQPWSGDPEDNPDDPFMLMYTSGTTGHPKGVVHTVNSLDCELCRVCEWWHMQAGKDVVLMPSPVTHVTGWLYGIMLPFTHGVRSVLMERWEADDAIKLIDREKATFTVAATPFLTELLGRAKASGNNLRSLRVFACGGAPVAPDIIRNAWSEYPNLLACRVYGSTEAPTVTLGVASRDNGDLAAETDGRIVGHDVRIVDETERDCPVGIEGEILVRGPELMVGYLDPADNEAAFDEKGYFRTGDLGRIDDQGCITISGRKKDLIIRGGENLSAKEIEDALQRHPAIFEAAVIGIPHPRLGETGCAVVRLVENAKTPGVAKVSAFLDGEGLARQKHPEKIVVVDDFPRTASGKIQKFHLRKSFGKGVDN